MLVLAQCPDPACGAPAEIISWATVGSTLGPTDHVRTVCVRRHIFLMPAAALRRQPARRPIE